MLRSPRPHRSAAAAPLALAALALSLAACDSKHGLNLAPDQPPTVTITSGPIDTTSVRQSWLVDIQWIGTDPDGRIDHYEYAIDPPGLRRARFTQAETAWVKTTENHVVAHFQASHPDSLGPGATASEFHVFVLRAIDDRGGISPDVVRAFYAWTVAPDVQITRPVPSELLSPQVPVPFRVEWRGNDPDGPGSGQPAYYRYRLVNFVNAATVTYLADPDSLLREGFQTDWVDWTRVPGDSTSLVVSADMVSAGSMEALAVVAVDDAGATTPYLMLDRNFLQFTVSPPGTDGPTLHIWSTVVDFTYQSGGYSLDPLRDISIQVGADIPFTVHWDAYPQPGRQVVASRWMVDGNVTDETPRSGPGDLAHWSSPVPPPTLAQIPGLGHGEHWLYIEVTDDFGGKSLGIVRIDAVTGTLAGDLLVVNDTRLEVDKYLPRGAGPSVYTQPWPSRAELDTFLFARGGYPWRGTQSPTTGVISPPGLLAGYPFDTLGTRLGLEDPALGVPLGTLAGYRHVLWLVDANAAIASQSLIYPTTVLAAISQPGVANTLAEYVEMGGQVWLAGGGAAYASLAAFDRRSNNRPLITVFSDSAGELGPGRILYDDAHIRSALGVTKTALQVSRSAAAIGGWSGQGTDGTLSAPDYSRLPAAMRPRDPSTDAVPPTRLPSQASLYYPTTHAAGFVLEPNTITEKFGPDSLVESTLDTLYDVSGAALPIPLAPVMLYYHGRDNAPFVYTGFEPWDWTRADCQGLFDFVLHDLWNLTKSAQPSSARASSASPTMRLVRTPVATRRAAVQMRR